MRQRIINFPENGSITARKQFYKLVVSHLEEVDEPASWGYRQYRLPSFAGDPLSLEEDTTHPYGLSMGLLRNLQYDAGTKSFYLLDDQSTFMLTSAGEQVSLVPRAKPQLRADRERMMEHARYQQKKKGYRFKGTQHPEIFEVPLSAAPVMIARLEDLLGA